MNRTLLVIDIQKDYFSGGALPLWQADETESHILSAIAKARAAGDKVVLVQHISAANTGLFAKDGAGAAIRDNVLKAADNAPVVIKSSADAFQDTNLAGHLNGTDELPICGMMTQNCVVFTAMSRAADGMVVKVIGDLCTAPTETVHRIALNALGSKLPVLVAADVWK